MPESNLEQQIAQIEQDLAAKRAALEQQKTESQELPPEKETLREIIGEQLQTSQPAANNQPLPANHQKLTTNPDTPSYMTEALNGQVQQLVNYAFAKSVSEAIKVAKTAGNAALIDAFHDAIVDELYNNLIEYRKLKKI